MASHTSISHTSMKRFVLSPLVAAIAAMAIPLSASAAQPTWPDVVVQLHGAGKAFIVDTKTDAVLATLDTCKGGTLGSTTPDGKKVYVSCAAPDETDVVVINLDKREVAKRIATGNRPKHGLVSPNGKLVGVDHWALSDGKLRITFLDAAKDEIAHTLNIDVAGEPKGVTSMHNAWSLDSHYFFTMNRVDNKVMVVDTSDWSVSSLASPSAPHYPVVSPDGKELWLVHEGSANVTPGVVIFDLTKPDRPVVKELSMPLTGEAALEAHHGNFSQDGKVFMILNRGPGDNLSGREVAFFDAKSKELLHRLTTASTGIGHTYNSPDGRHTVVTNYGNNVITIIDLKDMRTVADLTIGKGRMGHIAYTRDGKYGYVSNAGDGNLYKVDMSKFEVVKEISTGGGMPGGGQALNVWTNVFEELPR
jgi:DNA-binding beta-propeller fold protein YncE